MVFLGGVVSSIILSEVDTRIIASSLYLFKIYFNQTQIQTGKQRMTRMVQVLAEFHQILAVSMSIAAPCQDHDL